MRRKKKFGVYTNRTVKKLFYSWDFWELDEGPWKMGHQTGKNGKTVYRRSIYSKREAHKEGFGSTIPGKKFIVYNTRNYSPPLDKQHLPMKHLILKKEIRDELKESLQDYVFSEYCSSKLALANHR